MLRARHSCSQSKTASQFSFLDIRTHVFISAAVQQETYATATGTPFPRHQILYARPTRKSLIGARVPVSAEFVAALSNPKASRLVYRYSILPRMLSVIAYSTPAPAVQPLDWPPALTNGAAPVSAKAIEGLPVAHPPVPKTRKRSNATPSRPRIEP